MIYGQRAEEVAPRRKRMDWVELETGSSLRVGRRRGRRKHANSIGGKSNLQINFRTTNFTYLFRARLKVIDHYEHPDDADEDDQFDVATHVVASLSLSLSLYLSLSHFLWFIGQQLLWTFSLRLL